MATASVVSAHLHRTHGSDSWTIPAEPPGQVDYGADKIKPLRHRIRRQLQQVLRLGQKPAFLAVMALAITTATLAMMTVHEALNVAIDISPPRAGLPWQQQQQQQQSGRLSEVVPHRLLLATHNVLAWYYPQYDTMEELHRGEGVHYGMFPGEPAPGHPRTVWNVLRPHNWRPTSEQEHLMQFDADTGMELARVQIPARFTHDAIRMGERVYVCSTGDGSILELSYPGMKLLRQMHLFSEADHPNTLAAADADHLWVMLHNLGPSDLVKVYVGPVSPPKEVSRIRNIGRKAHGLVAWGRQAQQQLILLDSDNAALVSLDPATGDEVELWQVPEEGKFLKGLAVLDDIAYFGITTWSHRSVRDSADSHGELAAFDLMRNKLLWRRVVHTSGLLNIIGAPHIAPDSTYVATYTRTLVPPTVMQESAYASDTTTAAGGAAAVAALQFVPNPSGHPTAATSTATTGIPHSLATLQVAPPSRLNPLGPLVLPDSAAIVDAAVAHLAAAGHHPPRLGPTNYWSSGWPRLDIEPKLTSYAEAAGLQLPLFHADISALEAKLLAMPPAMWSKEEQAVSNAVMNGRNSNMERFKPGVDGMVLLFSDNNGEVVYQFPYYDYFKAELEPLLHEILGPADTRNIVRIQFAFMKPGTSDIKLHVDSGGYAKRGHRIHVPIITHPRVSFDVCPLPAPPEQLAAVGAAAAANAAPTPAAAALVADTAGLDAHEEDDGSSSSSGSGAPPSSRWWWLHREQKHSQPQQPSRQQQQTLLQQQMQHQEQQQMQAPAPLIRGLLAKQQQQQQQQQRQQQFDAENPNTCVKIPAPEGLVFELNNRVQHKVANPGPGPRVHLVIDVFEDYRPRTIVPAGSSCEYGGQLTSLQQISTIMQLALQEGMDEAALAAEIQLLLATAGMACNTPEGERILPRVTRAAAEDLAKRAADQQALIDALFTGMQLQGVATQRQGTAADGNTQQQVLGDAAAAQAAQGSEAQQQQLPAHSQQADPQRPAAAGQSLTGQSLTSAGTGGGAMRGLPFDQAALQKALQDVLQQQALQQLQPGLAAAGVSGTKKAA